MRRTVLVIYLLPLGCGGSGGDSAGTDADGGSDGAVDGGSDGDTDGDTDGDADGDTDGNCRTYPLAGKSNNGFIGAEAKGTFIGEYNESVHQYTLIFFDENEDEVSQVVWTWRSADAFVKEGESMGRKYHLTEHVPDEHDSWTFEHAYDEDKRLTRTFREGEEQLFTDWDESGRPVKGTFSMPEYCNDAAMTLIYDEQNRTKTRVIDPTAGTGDYCREGEIKIRSTYNDDNFQIKKEDQNDGEFRTIFELSEVTESKEFCLD